MTDISLAPGSAALPSLPDTITLRLAHPDDADAILTIHEEAFGPGRFARAAFRLREDASEAHDLCFVAEYAGDVIGSVVLSHILIGVQPALLLGPLAILPGHKSKGIGRALMAQAVAAARAVGHAGILLVGDRPYYGPLGFNPVPNGRVILPRPVDPARLLYCSLQNDPPEPVGEVRGRRH